MSPLSLRSDDLAAHALIGASDAMAAVRADIASAAQSDAKVLLTGETGVGKEVVARAVHHGSARSAAPFITINCAGVPDTLLESAFFGHARGSFTGAVRDSPGLLRQADRGTVLLDEVGEMSARMQGLLLRFLETGELQTVGAAGAPARVDVRLIAATNRQLLDAVAAREFREDLYYRLHVLDIRVPPLRERPSDIPLLLEHYLQRFAAQEQRAPLTLSPAVRDHLLTYAWPGNIRELRNVVERLVVRVPGAIIEPAHLPADIASWVPAARPAGSLPGRATVSHEARVTAILERLCVHRESFWTTAYPAFMARDITRDDLRHLVSAGLERSHGSYRVMVGLFNMPAGDYKRFLGFLKQHDCHVPFHRFRMLRAPQTADATRPAVADTA
jgi:DNA-binding NtrC family response regulator